jgi:outer membrane protein OmpA-like peptidoglycan-associated protein
MAEAEGLYGDAEFVGYKGNVDFFANPSYPRSLDKLSGEIQSAFAGIGLVQGGARLSAAGWDYARLRQGLSTAAVAETGRFDQSQVAAVVTRKQQQGTLKEGELFSFEIFFQPNQNGFSADLYQDAFAKVVDLASTYGGALITVEGHSDPMAYLRDKKAGKPEIVLGQVKQAAKNLSLSRAGAVRDSILGYAGAKGVGLDASQFAVVGHGISNPKSGICGSDPCAPKNEREWRDNMRVEFRIIQVEAESSVFKPL